eukprot:TRINITY_DN4147_c0_g1_i2.p1 TRINITY_DN4147_c0_g1~~TRINITY_DN4147_c0_g1_i2.p1  ORF type:complete len:221 (-),score=76.09 TRINITY_DN4147_c0_g1_i2:704-1303(-)
MDIDEDDNEKKRYDWEKSVERTWENVVEDENGTLRSITERKKKKRNSEASKKNVRRGMTRHLYIVMDLSKSMLEKDMKPSRLTVAVQTVEAFILDYFDQNPLSQLGVIVSRGAVAEKITELSGNPNKHIQTLKAHSNNVEGEMSLQNSLEVAKSSLWFVLLFVFLITDSSFWMIFCEILFFIDCDRCAVIFQSMDRGRF